LTPKRLHERREALVHFHNRYLAYLDATVGGHGGPQDAFQLRAEVISAIPAAQRALDAAHVGLVYTPPPAFGGPVMSGLPNLAFLHEGAPYQNRVPGVKPPYTDVIDMTRLGVQYLEDAETRERRRRHNPLYWIERAFLATLGFPAYVIGAVVGVPPHRIHGSVLGMPLRLIAVAADVSSLWAIGKAVGWY
jgi:hypothetical protein